MKMEKGIGRILTSMPRASGTNNLEQGFSLVELMISIAIGLALLAGITVLMVQQDRTGAELAKVSRQIENGRYATQVLRDDIELAGYFGEFFRLPTPSALANPCATSATTLFDAMALPIQGYDALSSLPSNLSTCLSEGNHVDGTDILIVRRADTATIPKASAAAGTVYLQAGLDNTNSLSRIVGTGSDTSVFNLLKRDGTSAPLRRYLTHIYFVSPCLQPASGTTCDGTSDDNGTPIPTLKRLELTTVGGAATFAITPLAEGIENLQVDYGIDEDGDGAPDYYTAGTYSTGTTPMTPTDWSNTMTVRLNILARSIEASSDHNDTKTYVLGTAGEIGPFNDRFKRKVFTETVRAVNPSGRRAQ